MHSKHILTGSFLLNAFALFLFTLTNKFFLVQAISRFLVGFCQIFICIYSPVWVDAFAKESHKTLMLTLLLLAPPLGVVIGYIMTAALTTNLSWQWAFYVQSILAIMPTALLISLIGKKYFDIESAVERKLEEIEDLKIADKQRALKS